MLERLKLDEGWSSFFLLLVMLISAAMSIAAARWTDELGHLATAAMFSLVLGLLLAKSRFPAVIAHLFSLVYGLFVVGYLIGRLIDQPTWRERLVELGERVVTWLTKATSGGTSRDSLMFVLLLAFLFWLLGHLAAWYTFRRPRLWRVLLPIGVTMLVNYYVYTDPRISTRSETSLAPFLGIFILATLVYVVRTNVFLREMEWRSSNVNYSTELRFDFVRSGTILATIALVVMVVAPGASASPQLSDMWDGVEDFRDNVRTTVSRLFASLDTRGRGIGNPFGNRAVLGGPRDLGDEVLLDIKARSGRYWQAMVYDRYTGSDWINTDDHKLLLPPGERVSSSNWSMREVMTQTVAVYVANTNQLYAAPEPLRVPGFSTEANITFEQGEVASVSALYSRKRLQPGNIYQIASSVSRADPDTLRSANQENPDEIERRYLQLPDTVTDRTRALAEEVTADHETVFDKAQAIEQYLRHNLTYDLNVPPPQEDQDFVDFVLFDLQSGYCDYYATSFVVMARSVGIPARIAMGYAQGEYDEEAKAYRVRARNGHSWPEVFFPRYGWIQFEPTVVIDPIDWPVPPSAASNSGGRASGDRNAPDPFDPREDMLGEEPDMSPGSYFPELDSSPGPSALFVALLGLLVAAGVGVGATYWITERRGLSGLSLVQRAYTRLWRFAARLGVPSPPDQTPFERADALRTLLPEAEPPINYITSMYVAERFGRGDGNGDGSNAEAQWTLLRPLLWKSWVQKKFSRFQKEQRTRWQDFYKTHPTGPRGGSGERSDR
jgi:transglutaminase-like putative cysteine protease